MITDIPPSCHYDNSFSEVCQLQDSYTIRVYPNDTIEVGSFVCGLVETFKVREPSEDIVDGEEVGSFEGGSVETVKVREPIEDVVDGEDDPNCVLAMDEDFSGTDNGEFRYIGSSDCVKIPHVIDKQ